MKLLPILFVLIATACNTGQNTTTVSDTLNATDTTKEIRSSQDDKAEQGISSEILGIWTDGSSENASFDIRKDSIYYVDEFATYKYSVTGDSIKIYYPDWTFSGAIKLSKDTLTISSQDGSTKYWKFKD